MAAPEFTVAEEHTALGFTVAADFLAAGSVVDPVHFTEDLRDFPTAVSMASAAA